jgi:protein TonB
MLAVRGPAIAQTQDSSTPSPPLTAQSVPLPSNVSSGLLIKRVQPVYSKYARKNRIQGIVLMHAAISKEGDIINVEVLSGPPILTDAAVTAVKQWKYRPYRVNGEPVQVETEIKVNFALAGG